MKMHFHCLRIVTNRCGVHLCRMPMCVRACCDYVCFDIFSSVLFLFHYFCCDFGHFISRVLQCTLQHHWRSKYNDTFRWHLLLPCKCEKVFEKLNCSDPEYCIQVIWENHEAHWIHYFLIHFISFAIRAII